MRLGAKTVLEVFEHTASAAAPCASSRRLQRPSAALRACDDAPRRSRALGGRSRNQQTKSRRSVSTTSTTPGRWCGNSRSWRPVCDLRDLRYGVQG
jgi:hypothetical protein